MVFGIVVTTAVLEANGPFIGSYMTDWATVWEDLTAIFADSTAWKYWNVCEIHHNGRKGYLALHDHYLRQNNVVHMASTADKIRQNAVYYE